MLISELKTKGEPFQGAQHKNGNWWIEVDPNQKIDEVVEGEFIIRKDGFIFKYMSDNILARKTKHLNIFRVTRDMDGTDFQQCFIPYIPRQTIRPMTAKEVWELNKKHPELLASKMKIHLHKIESYSIESGKIFFGTSFCKIEDGEYTLDFGETWQKFEVTENG